MKKVRVSLTLLAIVISLSGMNAPAQATKFHECASGTYKNSAGNCVHSPMKSPAWPAGASAECRDMTYSFSQHRRGTCSHHGGVMKWASQ